MTFDLKQNINLDNMSEKHFFAVDLGATSGRTIVGRLSDGRIALEELTRFDNNLIEVNGHFYWDIYALYFEIIKGLKVAKQRNIEIASIGIDTWGVDFVCVADDGSVSQPLAYRDPHTFKAMDDYLQNVMPREKVYDITGIQFMNFNSIFQLHAMRCSGNSVLKNAKKILFIPDALSYMLTGKMVCEYTIASTSQLLNPHAKCLDDTLLASLGLTQSHFGTMVNSGDLIGTLTPEAQKMTGLGAVPVVVVAGHDTASAVAAVPAQNERFAYLSSGTWSLMGIETKNAIINNVSYDRNFTNEGGIEGTTRFLKNISECGSMNVVVRNGRMLLSLIRNLSLRLCNNLLSKVLSILMMLCLPILPLWLKLYKTIADKPISTCHKAILRYAVASLILLPCVIVWCSHILLKWQTSR